MRTDIANGSSSTMTTLVSGILADVQQLVGQQMQLLRVEIREDLHKARTGAMFLGAGLGVSVIGGLLLCFMLPHLLHSLTHEQLPLWACFGICGVVLFFVGIGASYAAMKTFQSAASLKESNAALKENLTCLLKRN